jgi:RimJ/RimL family protein N-acetyltransferase
VIVLRPVQTADIDIFYEHQADPVAVEMAATTARDQASHREFWTKRILVNPDGVARTVVVDGVVAGNIISWIDSGERMVGYRYGRAFWGRGIATEALRLYVDQLEERPLYADVAVHNIGSQRVLEKAGFRRISDAPKIEDDGVKLYPYRLD